MRSGLGEDSWCEKFTGAAGIRRAAITVDSCFKHKLLGHQLLVVKFEDSDLFVNPYCLFKLVYLGQ